jgi:hypothetical protein
MITPPLPEALVFLQDALKYPAHLERLLPALNHSQAWKAMVSSVERAHQATLERYQLHTEALNDRSKRDAEQ